MKHIIHIIAVILMGSYLHAQQLVQFNHYFFKPMVYNPAFTGNSDAPNLMVINHTQWTGFKGGPQYNVLTFDGNAINKNTGLGITLLSDKKGVNSRVGGNISYSYKLRFKKENVYLLLGLSAGAVSQSLDYSKAVIQEANDPSLFTTAQRSTTFDANAGLAFVYKRLEAGVSAPQLANNKISYTSANGKAFYTQARSYMGSLKYRFPLSKKKDITFSPLALVRYTANTPLQYDVNATLDVENKFWIGATYKSNYAVGANVGVNLFKRLSIGYSYDFITGSVGKYAGLSHEIMLNFKFIKSKKEPLTTEQAEDEELKKMASRDLNKLIIERLFRRIEEVLDKDNATPEEIQALMDEISSFLDSDSTDPNQETLKKYYKSLKNQINGEYNVLVKGIVFLDDSNNTSANYSKVLISITDLGTKTIVATSKPSLKDGKYYILLKPGNKYLIIAECEGYKTYSKKFSPVGSTESYEMSQEIHLTK